MGNIVSNIKPKISIVVPIYNNEVTLCRCLDSIQTQTYKNFECIIFNDGSQDGSARVAMNYAKQDARFILKENIKNEGVLATRKSAVSLATGSYLGFVDGDDWVHPKMYEWLISSMLKYNADISVCGVYISDRSGKIKSGWTPKKTGVEDPIQLNKFARYLYGPGYLCNKLYRTSLAKTVFQRSIPLHLSTATDTLFNFGLFSNAQTLALVSRRGYYYFTNDNSITRKVRKQQLIINLLRAYCACHITYREMPEDALKQIDVLYTRQLRMPTYRLTAVEFTDQEKAELAESVRGLLEVRPISVYYLYHAFDYYLHPSENPVKHWIKRRLFK